MSDYKSRAQELFKRFLYLINLYHNKEIKGRPPRLFLVNQTSVWMGLSLLDNWSGQIPCWSVSTSSVFSHHVICIVFPFTVLLLPRYLHLTTWNLRVRYYYQNSPLQNRIISNPTSGTQCHGEQERSCIINSINYWVTEWMNN